MIKWTIRISFILYHKERGCLVEGSESLNPLSFCFAPPSAPRCRSLSSDAARRGQSFLTVLGWNLQAALRQERHRARQPHLALLRQAGYSPSPRHAGQPPGISIHNTQIKSHPLLSSVKMHGQSQSALVILLGNTKNCLVSDLPWSMHAYPHTHTLCDHWL